MPSKLTKDANAPKKPLSAYILFSVDERPKLKATGLDNFAEMSKTLAAAGKQAHYEKEHEQEKIRFENELKEYQKSDQPAPPSKVGQKLQLVSKSETTKSTTTTTAATKSKKSATAVKNESEDDEESEVQSEKEEKKNWPHLLIVHERKSNS